MTDTAAPASDLTTPAGTLIAEPHVLTPHVALGRVIMLVNPLSGGVGPNAAEEAAAILGEYPCEASIVALEADSSTLRFRKRSTPGLTFCLSWRETAQPEPSRRAPDPKARLSRRCRAAP